MSTRSSWVTGRSRRLLLTCLAAAAALLVAWWLVIGASGASASVNCAKPAGGGDWPSYGQNLAGDRYQPAEHQLGPSKTAGLTPAFVFKTTSSGMSGDFQATPVEVDGCVYMGTSTGWVFAINADTGAVVWKTELPVGAAGLLGTGIVGSPAVSEGRVIVNVSQAGSPYAAALDQNTGRLLWRTTLDDLPGAYNDASPVVYRGLVFSGFNGDEEESGTARGGYDIIDAATGKRLVHTYTIPDAPFKQGYTGGSIWATAAVDTSTGYAYVGTGNPAGTTQYPTTNAILKIDLDQSRSTFGQIVAHYSGTPDAAVPAGERLPTCKATEGQIIYVVSAACTHEDMDFGGSPSLFHDAKGQLLVGELQKSGIYHTIYVTNMTRKWMTEIGQPAVITNGDSGATDGKRVYVEGTPPGQLVALDVSTGQQLWDAPIGDQVHFESIAVADGVVYTVTSYNNFVAYNAATGQQLLNRSLAEDAGVSEASQPNDTAASVSIARDTVYLANGEAIIAYRNGQPSPPPPSVASCQRRRVIQVRIAPRERSRGGRTRVFLDGRLIRSYRRPPRRVRIVLKALPREHTVRIVIQAPGGWRRVRVSRFAMCGGAAHRRRQ